MLTKRMAFVSLILFGGCSLPGPGVTQQPGSSQWAVGCYFSAWKGFETMLHGKQTMTIKTPCKQLDIRSYVVGADQGKTPGKVPTDQVFRKIAEGKVADWSWKLAGTPAVVRHWRNDVATPATTGMVASRSHGPRVSWRSLFTNMHAVYRYVLADAPPPSRFLLYFFPSDMTIERTITASAVSSITLPLFFPYGGRSGGPTARQSLYIERAALIPCFEYMHALFWTKRLKVPNMLSHSVADWVTCWALQLVKTQNPKAVLTLMSAQQTQAMLRNKGPALLRNGAVDDYASLLAGENIAHAFGFDKEQVKIYAHDKAAVSRLLKLARAMLQQPVDFTKQQLYPLDRLDSVPAYTGTPADISAKH